jgi:hypothetical protein
LERLNEILPISGFTENGQIMHALVSNMPSSSPGVVESLLAGNFLSHFHEFVTRRPEHHVRIRSVAPILRWIAQAHDSALVVYARQVIDLHLVDDSNQDEDPEEDVSSVDEGFSWENESGSEEEFPLGEGNSPDEYLDEEETGNEEISSKIVMRKAIVKQNRLEDMCVKKFLIKEIWIHLHRPNRAGQSSSGASSK